MAKDGTNRGGARIGAGPKKKPLHDKVLAGNPGKRPLTVMEFNDTADLDSQAMPLPREFLKTTQKSGKVTLAVEIYKSTWNWLNERRCAHLIPAQLLEQYAMSVSRWIQCEEAITEFGFLPNTPPPATPSRIRMWEWRRLYETGQQSVVSDLPGGQRKQRLRLHRRHSTR